MHGNCTKCGGRMSEGFLIDEGYGIAHAGTWQSGEPRKSFWGGVKKSKKDQTKVSTFRCDRCGYLESYAKG